MLIGPISDLLNTVLKRVLPAEKMSEEMRAKVEGELLLELSKMDWSVVQGQLEINKAEAQSEGWFKGGWRPAVGWICAFAFAYHFIILPFLQFLLIGVMGMQLPPLPTVAIDYINTVMMGMLGLGGLRTFEKFKGVAKNKE